MKANQNNPKYCFMKKIKLLFDTIHGPLEKFIVHLWLALWDPEIS